MVACSLVVRKKEEVMPISMEAEKNPQQEAKDLLRWVKEGKWNEVVERYKSNPNTHKVRITRSGDTVLHIAVLHGNENIVKKLVEVIDEASAIKTMEKRNASAATKQGDDSAAKEQGSASEVKEEASASAAKEQAEGNASAETTEVHPLKMVNERGNTPLHLAASIGNVGMCKCIAQKDKDLVGARNKLGETPFFLAALHGKKDAFLHLHEICGLHKGYEYCRKKNGETILHCAIAGEYFDLASKIIDEYGNLANYFDEEGLTPLHLLASIYIRKEELTSLGNATSNGNKVDKVGEKYPMNYQTCMNFLDVLAQMWNMIAASGNEKGTKEKENSGGQTTSQNQDTVDENLEKQTRNCLKDLWKIITTCKKDSQKSDPEDPAEEHASASRNRGNEAVDEDQVLCPPNYYTCFEFVKVIYRAMMVVLGIGSRETKKLRVMKKKHIWSARIMRKLLERASPYEYDYSAGSQPDQLPTEITNPTAAPIEENEQKGQKDQKIDGKRVTFNIKDKGCVFDVDFSKGEVTLATVLEGNKQKGEKEAPILIAAKNGITEMVKGILDSSPVAIHEKNSANKNIVMLAVENRQPKVYELLLEKKMLIETLFHAVDDEGNSALHLAAMATHHQPWLIPGAALQMQWEIKWYEYVKESMPMNFFVRYNKANKTASEIFTEKHEELVKKGSEWLNHTSNSCSVVAALIATVAFATSANVPGGIKEGEGIPNLVHKPAFNVFSISSLIALCFSVNSLVMFLAILTSRHQERDFGSNLPNKLLFGLSSLFISIAAILASFCAGHFFLLKDELKFAALPIYAVTCLPVAFFAMMQFPLYLDLMWATFKKVPKRCSTAVS